MNTFKKHLMDFLKEEEGLTTVEYAIAGSLVAAGVVAAFSDLGIAVCGVITGIENVLDGTATDYVYTPGGC
jgi:pilus assembly protein Flp/PilA